MAPYGGIVLGCVSGSRFQGDREKPGAEEGDDK
jgi:hypothetical protein